MRNPPAQIIRLTDYQPPDFLIDSVELDIRLHPTQARVRAKLSLRRNPEGRAEAPLTLDGDGLTPLGARVDGRLLDAAEFEVFPEGLTLHAPPPVPFVL
ncbi:MAG TPA: aminopeptidase N, partial [Methylocystis sp.]|nr:aminopeptidase N [Methylocystis sp.]